MITHQEAEVLTSARQDAPLDAVVERELQAHLATCDQCRSFAAATERLTAGIRMLPGIAANPRMKREVMERVRAGRGPFAGLLGGFGNGFYPGPAFAAIAMVAVIGMFGWLALDRLFLDDGGDGNNQIAAVPTTEITLEMASLTEAPQPTATVVPATETPTQIPAPTATTAPVPTESAAPTQPPVPTATTAPAPTATVAPEPTATSAPVPTATTAPEPTATVAPEPTVEPTPEDVPINLTGVADPTATVAPTVEPTPEPTPTEVLPTATLEPTATEVLPTAMPEPTATEVPATVEPTATEIPPTPTTEAIPAATETPVPEPTPTPAIEPMDGATSEPVGAGDSGSVLGIGSADEDAGIPVTPENAGGDGQQLSNIPAEATEAPTEDVGGNDDGAAVIEPIDPGNQESAPEPTRESTAETSTEMTEGAASGPATQSLIDVSERYSGIAGDPAGDLGLTGDGRLEFVTIPDAGSMTTAEGFRLQMADSQPGVVQLCGDGFCEPGTDAPEAEGWQGDVPLGVMENTAYILRLYGDRSEVYALRPQGTQLLEGTLIGEFGPVSAPFAVYESGGSLYAWLPNSQWLQVSGDSAQVLSGMYTDPANVRFAPSAEGGPLIGYFSEGSLVIAPVSAPDAALMTLPSDGVDFDISPPGDRVAMIRGNDIVIFDLQGNELTVYEGGDTQPGSLIWLRSGIIWVDRATGALYQIPETAP